VEIAVRGHDSLPSRRRRERSDTLEQLQCRFVQPRGQWREDQLQKTALFLKFSNVCPESVLAK
jgi:hypothetical protein